MYQGKYLCAEADGKKKRALRPAALILALTLVIGCAVGGTVAWLTAATDPVVNTFTYGDIDLTLEETKLDENGVVVKDADGNPVKTTEGNEYEMIPGAIFLKDPVVTVAAGSEACWLFVKLEETGGVTITEGDGSETTYTVDDYLDYTVDEGWAQLLDENGEAVAGVYYRRVAESEEATALGILTGNAISVKSEVTKDMLNALDNNGQAADSATYPTLSITAYAVQYFGFEAEDEAAVNAAALKAWNTVQSQTVTTEP